MCLGMGAKGKKAKGMGAKGMGAKGMGIVCYAMQLGYSLCMCQQPFQGHPKFSSSLCDHLFSD